MPDNSTVDIKILPPFSLDLHWDSGDPDMPNGSFQILKNYMPENDIIRTRKGITIFTFT